MSQTVQLGRKTTAAAMPAGGAGVVGWLSAIYEAVVTTPVVALDAASLAALESITVGGTIELGATSLAALESITAVGPLTDAQLRAAAVPVSGTVALDAASLAALESITVVDGGGLLSVDDGGGLLSVDDGGGSLTVDGTVALDATTLAALESITAVGPLTNTELRAAAVPVSLAANTPDVTDRAARLLGHVTVDNASIAVTGPLTDAQLRAAAVPVSLAANTPDVTDRAARLLGHVTVDNASIAVTGPLTDAQLRAAAAPVDTNAALTQKTTYLVSAAVSTGLLTAATAKQILSLEHAAGAAKTVKIRRIDVGLVATTAVAGNVTMTINRGTAVSSAGAAAAPVPTNPGSAAAEVSPKTNPTIVAATVVDNFNFGALAASGVIASVTVYKWDPAGEQQPLTLRAANLDTLVLVLTSSAGQTITPTITIYLTEE